MTDAYRPHVYLNGKKLPDSLGFADLTPLRSFSIRWGAADWFESVDPAELTLTLIDPLGEFLDFAENESIPVTIERDDPTSGPESVTVFTGSVVSATSELSAVMRPNGTRIDVWIVTVVAKDPLHTLAQNRSHGRRYFARAGVDMGADWHFGPCRMGDRKNELEGRSPVPIDWEPTEYDWLDNEDPIMVMPISGYEVTQNVSSLTVLQNTARISDILNRPHYDPRRSLIDFVSPSRFAWNDRGLYLDPWGVLQPQAGELDSLTILSGDEFTPSGRISASTESVEQVNRIELNQRTMVDIVFGGVRTRETNETVTEQTFVTGVSQMTVSITTDASAGYYLPDLWFIGAASLIDQAYGSQSLGQLTWKPTPDSDPQLVQWLLNPFPPMNTTYHRPMMFTLVNSLTNWAPKSGPFGVTGGEIKHGEHGWQVTIDTAPIGYSDYNELTLAELGSDVNLSWLPPYLVADYQKITGNA